MRQVSRQVRITGTDVHNQGNEDPLKDLGLAEESTEDATTFDFTGLSAVTQRKKRISAFIDASLKGKLPKDRLSAWMESALVYGLDNYRLVIQHKDLPKKQRELMREQLWDAVTITARVQASLVVSLNTMIKSAQKNNVDISNSEFIASSIYIYAKVKGLLDV